MVFCPKRLCSARATVVFPLPEFPRRRINLGLFFSFIVDVHVACAGFRGSSSYRSSFTLRKPARSNILWDWALKE